MCRTNYSLIRNLRGICNPRTIRQTNLLTCDAGKCPEEPEILLVGMWGRTVCSTPQAALVTTSTGTVDEECLQSVGFKMLRPRSKWPVYHFFLSRTEPQRNASICYHLPPLRTHRWAIAEGPRDALCQLKSWQLLHVQKTAFYKACDGWMTLKITQGHGNCHLSIGRISPTLSDL